MDFSSLRSVQDFDMGTGDNLRSITRISALPSNITSLADFKLIIWILTERYFQGLRGKGEDQYDSKPIKPTTEDLPCGAGGDGVRTERDGHRPQYNRDQVKRTSAFIEDVLQIIGIDIPFKALSRDEKDGLIQQFSSCCEMLAEEKFSNIYELYQALSRVSSRFKEEFRVNSLIGKGKYGDVFSAELKKKEMSNPVSYDVFAIKRVQLTLDEVDNIRMILNEARVLKKLAGHPRIVKCFQTWLAIESSDDSLIFYVQMELCGESLHQWKEKTENSHRKEPYFYKRYIVLILQQSLEALVWIHRHGVLHLDINPKNIFWNNSSHEAIKIGDFGLAVEDVEVEGRRGTPFYTAKETILTEKSDIYSLGVTMCVLISQTQSEVADNIEKQDFSTPSQLLNFMLPLLLAPEPQRRLSASEALVQLHEYEYGTQMPGFIGQRSE